MTPATTATATQLRDTAKHARRRLRDVSAAPVAPERCPPPFGPGLVARPRLVQRLAEARDVPLALVVAPAGYGKTTALAEWAACDPRPFAWLALEPGDDDAARLVAAIALALDEVEPLGRGVLAALRADGADGARRRRRPPRDGDRGPPRSVRARPRRRTRPDVGRRAQTSSTRSSATSRRARCSSSRRGASRRCPSAACARTAASSRSARASCR